METLISGKISKISYGYRHVPERGKARVGRPRHGHENHRPVLVPECRPPIQTTVRTGYDDAYIPAARSGDLNGR